MQDKYNFLRKETNKWEKVSKEAWEWIAHYNDGTQLRQFDPAYMVFHQFGEIDQSKLESFDMFNEETGRTVTIAFNSSTMKLIHFYRNVVLENGMIKFKAYFFGYEKEIGTQTVKAMMAIMPDGNIALVDDLQGISFVASTNNETPQ